MLWEVILKLVDQQIPVNVCNYNIQVMNCRAQKLAGSTISEYYRYPDLQQGLYAAAENQVSYLS